MQLNTSSTVKILISRPVVFVRGNCVVFVRLRDKKVILKGSKPVPVDPSILLDVHWSVLSNKDVLRLLSAYKYNSEHNVPDKYITI